MTQTIIEYENPDRATFRDEVYANARPAVLRGVGAELEAVKLAKSDPQAFADWLKNSVGSREIDVLSGKEDAGPTFFYDPGVTELNFTRGRTPFATFIDEVFGSSDADRMIYLESTPIAELSPALAQALSIPLMPESMAPRVWMGNHTGTHTHFDIQQNVAYVVSGRRRFTLYPPSQTPNLYMAPFEKSPSGAPISLVQPEDPDLERFPRFAEAMEHAVRVELGPGDAIFIPYMWWHHVKATGRLNILVNYWWNEFKPMGSPVDAMLHAILTVRDLPPPMREAWQTMFETFVFKQHGEPMEYLEPSQRGGLGPIDERARVQMWQSLGASLSETMQRAFNAKV